jgi:hypothetical protein
VVPGVAALSGSQAEETIRRVLSAQPLRASNLLKGPTISIEVGEEREAGTGSTFRSQLLDVRDRDTSLCKCGAYDVDVLHHQLHTLGGTGLAQWQPVTDDDRARRARRRELNYPHLFIGSDIVIEPEPDSIDVKGLRGVNIGYWYADDLKSHVHVLLLLGRLERAGHEHVLSATL